MIRVLIVDDSATARTLIEAVLQTDPQIRVVGTAGDGAEAIRQAQLLKPDLITMDVNMPVMDGLEATRRILEVCPTPIVVVSAGVDSPEMKISFNALKVGALDVVSKPVGLTHKDFEAIRDRLVMSVKLMSEIKVLRRRASSPDMASIPLPYLTSTRSVEPDPATPTPAVVAIGSSTGGPGVLNTLFRTLPADFPLPIVVVQHITAGFTQGLVDWLRAESRLPVCMIAPGTRLRPGVIHMAPDDQHVEFASRSSFYLSQGERVSFVRPSATVLFESVARHFGAESAGVLLTGMGDDGALGLKAMHDAGALTIAQDEASCVVYGMPRVAFEMGAARRVLNPPAIVRALVEMARGGALIR
ncbi:chemotaxis-specific protein-glutamate methyltransferase CheB [Isosphaeraceae bacterium EP7]